MTTTAGSAKAMAVCNAIASVPSGYKVVAQLRHGDNNNTPTGPSEYSVGNVGTGQYDWGADGNGQLDSGWVKVRLVLNAGGGSAGVEWSVGFAQTLVYTGVTYGTITKLVVQAYVSSATALTLHQSWRNLKVNGTALGSVCDFTVSSTKATGSPDAPPSHAQGAGGDEDSIRILMQQIREIPIANLTSVDFEAEVYLRSEGTGAPGPFDILGRVFVYANALTLATPDRRTDLLPEPQVYWGEGKNKGVGGPHDAA